jgi:hypothetical protein
MDDVDAQIIADRNRDIQQLDRDMEDLAEVYQVEISFQFVEGCLVAQKDLCRR